MQKKLDSLIEHQLSIRVEIARATAVFTARDLATGFAMSLATLHRYVSPQARELSRDSARRQTNAIRMEREESRGKCRKCNSQLHDHPRCEGCDILLHEPGRTCGARYCIDTLERSTVSI